MNWLRRRKTSRLPSRSTLPTKPVEYPAGICVRSERGPFFIHRDGQRYRIPTQAVLDSWSFPFVVDSSEAALSKYPVAVTKIAFRDGTLLNNIADGKLYLVSAGRLRHVTSPAVLERLGNPEPLVVSDAEIKIMKKGEEIY